MKLGIIGYGTIVREFLPGLLEMSEIQIPAILGQPGREEKLEALCREFGIPRAVYTLEDMAAAGTDTVYIAVPNHLHFPYAKMALEAGLNVIVEKPMTSTLREAEQLQDLAREKGRFLFEAITTLYLSGYEKIAQWLPRIGRVRLVQGQFCQYSRRYEAFCRGEVLPVFDPNKSGGALMDLNVYNLHFVTGLFGAPQNVRYTANVERGIDTSGVLVMDYPDFTALCTAAKDCTGACQGLIQGTLGTIRTGDAVSRLGTVTLELLDGTREVFPDPIGDHRHLREFAAFQRAIDEGDMAFCQERLAHSLAVMGLLTQARRDAGIRFPADL